MSSAKDSRNHLHVVIDDELRERLETHAKKLMGKNDRHSRPNLSAAVRDVLRVSMGLRWAAREEVTAVTVRRHRDKNARRVRAVPKNARRTRRARAVR